VLTAEKADSLTGQFFYIVENYMKIAFLLMESKTLKSIMPLAAYGLFESQILEYHRVREGAN
jgi:hypothetical protein